MKNISLTRTPPMGEIEDRVVGKLRRRIMNDLLKTIQPIIQFVTDNGGDISSDTIYPLFMNFRDTLTEELVNENKEDAINKFMQQVESAGLIDGE